MVSAAAPPPIAGTVIDPPPREVPEVAERLDRNRLGGVAYRALRRYQYANVGLLANGTAYFLLLSLLSVLAFAFGVITLVGADELADWLTETLADALPGLVGEAGIDPELLRAAGRAAGIIGLVSALYGGLGSVGAAASSLHLIYGAPPDPRPFAKAKLRQLGVLATMAPLMLLSLAASSLTSSALGPLLAQLGLESGAARVGLSIAGLAVGFALDLLIIWLLLGWIGGIRPHPVPRRIGALVGAVLVGLIKVLLSLIIGWVVARPQYGALAIPLAVLFVFALLSQALYIAGAVAAAVSDEDRPLSDLQPEEAPSSEPPSDQPPAEEPPSSGPEPTRGPPSTTDG